MFPSFKSIQIFIAFLEQKRKYLWKLQQLLTAPSGLCQNDVSAWVAPAMDLKMAGATHAETSF